MDVESKRFIKHGIREGINGIIDDSRPLDLIRKKKIRSDYLIYKYVHCKPEFGCLLTGFYDQSNRDSTAAGFKCISVLKYYYNKYSFLQNKYFIKSGKIYSRSVIISWENHRMIEDKYYTFDELEYDYDFIKKTKHPLNKAFIAWYYHPSRINSWIDDE
jgi:hypothetical protein